MIRGLLVLVLLLAVAWAFWRFVDAVIDTFGGLPKNGRGYREATAEIEHAILRLWHWLEELHAKGRPKGATPP